MAGTPSCAKTRPGENLQLPINHSWNFNNFDVSPENSARNG